MTEKIVNVTEKYVAPIAAAASIVILMLLNAYLWGKAIHWTAGAGVMCIECIVLYVFVVYIYPILVSSRSNEEFTE